MRGLVTFLLTLIPSVVAFSRLSFAPRAATGHRDIQHHPSIRHNSLQAKEWLKKQNLVLLMAESDLEAEEEQGSGKISNPNLSSGPKKSNATGQRIGGRSKSPSKPTPNVQKRNENKTGMPKLLIAICIPLLALWVFFQTLFGGEDSPSTYYYQSSVYESRVYNADGQVETSRKESVRSNVPSLLEERRNDRRESETSDFSSYILRGDIDEQFDKELESMMRVQQKILEDFFR